MIDKSLSLQSEKSIPVCHPEFSETSCPADLGKPGYLSVVHEDQLISGLSDQDVPSAELLPTCLIL